MATTFNFNVQIDEFELLILKPFSWNRIVPVSLGVIKGDRLQLNEVDSLNVPTGRYMIGIAKFVSFGDEIVNNNADLYVYCESVSEFVGSGSIGGSFIVL